MILIKNTKLKHCGSDTFSWRWYTDWKHTGQSTVVSVMFLLSVVCSTSLSKYCRSQTVVGGQRVNLLSAAQTLRTDEGCIQQLSDFMNLSRRLPMPVHAGSVRLDPNPAVIIWWDWSSCRFWNLALQLLSTDHTVSRHDGKLMALNWSKCWLVLEAGLTMLDSAGGCWPWLGALVGSFWSHVLILHNVTPCGMLTNKFQDQQVLSPESNQDYQVLSQDQQV